ncbi:MAG: T9SS type A sorting domain-containing protein [Oceanihabitans sp.]|nr:T9SS type A sorting domain-containing protein [Oceanihabitans sp.]
MKKATFLMILLITSLGFSQTPNPNTPTNADADVVSVYGDTYTSIATNYDPNWGQSGHTQVNTTFNPGDGSALLAYPNFNYQGTEITAGNISAMEFLHVEIWTAADPANTDIQITPINQGSGAGETLVSIAYTSGTWTSVDIPKSSFTNMTWDDVFQMKFAANGAGSTVPVDIYLDNIYFWKAPIVPGSDATLSDLQVDASTITGFSPTVFNYTVDLPNGTTVVPQITTATSTDPSATSVTITQAPAIPGDATVVIVSQNGTVTETYTVSFTTSGPATAAPTPPNRPAADVISLFSNAYTDITVTEWSTVWDSADIEDVLVDGNDTKKITYGDFLGVDFSANSFDATGFTHCHIDYYVDEALTGGEVLLPKWSNHTGGAGETNAFIYTEIVTVSEGWVSFDIPLSSFTAQGDGGTATDNFSQFILGTGASINTLYIDNIYLHKNTILSTNEFQLSDIKVYPNPSQDVWNIKTENIVLKTIEVFDILGKRVLLLNPNAIEATLDATALNSGLYFAKLHSDSGTTTLKLVKE